ncbi:MAG TPA: hypothetical protein VKG24_06390 [Pseudolabrys sp.]|jgi:hypothetical protein|nr:hypothetical protein [Pseudolabrys sp.]
MRISTLALVCALAFGAASASAQTVIDVEGQKPASPQVQDQGQAQPPEQQAPAQVPDNPQPAPSGRFSLNRVENGFLRLDNESGQIAFCNAQTAGWACQLVPVDRPALETEIARLRDEVASLKKEIATLKEPPPPPRPPADLTPPSEKGADVTIKLPTQEDIARVRAFMEETWRRLVEMITTVQKDMMRRS